MDVKVLNSGVEGALKTAFAQILAGKDAEGSVVLVALWSPEVSQFGDGVDAPSQTIVVLHEVFVANAQVA